ncbi:8726_t:CDS:1 [Acaulospora morrowiae]|uniref:8726_t:CDS:1 n=1 Tax=Acaulospora morrowiae TaxID=94023 RepID=A0A9N9HJ14_9GLOM|nr:8726_t:CDS:1 [Acaulospora morrowiae]
MPPPQPSNASSTKPNQKIWFSHAPNTNEFQQGLLGLTESYLAGNLCIQFPEVKPLKAKKIEVSITGTEYVYWTDEVFKTRYVHDSIIGQYREETSNETTHYRHEKQFLNIPSLLWRSNDLIDGATSKKEPYANITQMILPFQISLPNNLPPSMNLGIGHIYYNVCAKIKRKSKFWKLQGSEKSIKCECLITRYSPMPSPSPVRWVKWDDQEAQKRGLGYDISTNYSTFGPVNPVVVNLAIKFLTLDLKLTEIFVGLKEYRLFKASEQVKIEKGYIRELRVSGNQFPGALDAYDEWSYDFKIDVLEEEVSWATKTHHIEVYHKVKIKIIFGPGDPKNVKLARRINIKNILDVNDI